MANTSPSNFLPPDFGPSTGWDISMRQVVGGDPRFFDYGRFGILKDTSVLRERVEGDARRARGARWAINTGSGSAGIQSFGGGTPSNPGAYNWQTLSSTAANTADGVRWAFKAARTAKRASDQRKANQWEQTKKSYTNAWNPSMNYSYAYQQAAQGLQQPPTSGAASTKPTGAPQAPIMQGQTSNIKNPKDPIEAANKGLQEWRKNKMSSRYPNPEDPNEAANKGIGDMLRAQRTKAEAARLSSADLYKVNKSLREMFPNFYKNQ